MRPIDGDAMRQDLRRQFEAIYKSAIETPIMPDDPFVELLAKSDGLHMQLYIDELCEYIDSRPAIDAAPVRRGEWVYGKRNGAYGIWCSRCGTGWGESPNYEVIAVCHNFCPNCGSDMRKEEHHGPED